MIIAVDFDGTLCTNKFPEIGEQEYIHKNLVDYLLTERKKGNLIILHTCREDMPEREYLTEAVNWCKEKGITFDAVNENLLSPFGNGRKVFADIYIDDKAINVKAFRSKCYNPNLFYGQDDFA